MHTPDDSDLEQTLTPAELRCDTCGGPPGRCTCIPPLPASENPWAAAMAAKAIAGDERAWDSTEAAALYEGFARLERTLAGEPHMPDPDLVPLTYQVGKTGAVTIEVPQWLAERLAQ